MQETGSILLGGWAVPPDAYVNALKNEPFSHSMQVADYGFFQEGSGVSMHLPAPESLNGKLVFAHSMGTLAALLAAGRDHAEPEAMILWNPFARFTRKGENDPGWTPQQVQAMKAKLSAKPQSLLRTFIRTCASPLPSPFSLPETRNLKVLADGLDFLENADAEEFLDAVRCPVLLCVSDDSDQVVPPALWQSLRDRLRNRTVLEIPGAGHLLPFAGGNELSGKIREFVNGVRAS